MYKCLHENAIVHKGDVIVFQGGDVRYAINSVGYTVKSMYRWAGLSGQSDIGSHPNVVIVAVLREMKQCTHI